MRWISARSVNQLQRGGGRQLELTCVEDSANAFVGHVDSDGLPSGRRIARRHKKCDCEETERPEVVSALNARVWNNRDGRGEHGVVLVTIVVRYTRCSLSEVDKALTSGIVS